MNKLQIQQLIHKAKGRDPDAFTELVSYYMKDLYRTALAILRNDEDAADAIQDTILTCWEKIETLQKPEYFKTWLTRVLINRCYDIRKSSLRFTSLELEEEPVTYDQDNLELKEILESLGEKYSIILTLYYSMGYTAAEIGEILDIPAATVRTRLARGREKLKEHYQNIRK